MQHSLIGFLGSQPMMKLIRGLYLSKRPRHLRDLAAQYSLSPSGVSDILRRLGKLGVLKEERIGNRRCFSLALPDEERACLAGFFSTFESQMLTERAVRLQKDANIKLEWMDEANKFFRGIKGEKV